MIDKARYSSRASSFTQADSSLVDYLRTRASKQPDLRAYIFLVDGEREEESLTYSELDCRARAIAAALQARVGKGERALLLYPPGLEFTAAFFGCLYAGVIAVPAYPPRLNRNLLRLQAIVRDAKATIVLAPDQIVFRARTLFDQNPELKTVQWLVTNQLAGGVEKKWSQGAINADDLAFLQYTSGSTGEPKGVMLTHANLLYNAAVISHVLDHKSTDKYASWLPTYHDMGFMAGVLQPLYAEVPVVLMSPASFLQRPARWLEAISRYKATTSGGPNFAYDLCIRKITEEQRAQLDLSSWTVAFNGAEPVRAETMENFVNRFAECGFRREAFYPCYGLAEATLMVSGGLKDAPSVNLFVSASGLERHLVSEEPRMGSGARGMVGCGATMPGQQVAIARPETMARCSPDEVGEIWVSGPSVAQGYWGNPMETERTFRARLADTGEGPFLRTGDLGFLRDGELFVTGRLKDLIIIRGSNYYPQDIELTVGGAHPALRAGLGAAFSVEILGEERLIVVQEINASRATSLDEVMRSIQQAVAEEHQLQAYAISLVKPATVPKTSSGKTQRRACRELFLADNLDPVKEWRAATEAPESLEEASLELAGAIRSRLAIALGLDPSQLVGDRPITQYGLDSMAAIELAHSIETDFGVKIDMADLLAGCSIDQIAALASRQAQEEGFSPGSVAASVRRDANEHPVSHGQKALWFLYRLTPDSAAYNIAVAVRIKGDLDKAALRDAFQTLVDRHASLRTTFFQINGEPFQRIHERAELCFQDEDASSWDEESLAERLTLDAYAPFCLEKGPLMRVSLLARSSQECVLLLAAHHIITDFWSLAALIDELGVLYQSLKRKEIATLAPVTSRYSDYAYWQQEMLAGERGERLWEYWKNRLAAASPLPNLPTDRPRPAVQTYRGGAVSFELPPELTRELKQLSLSEGATLYMTLLAAFQTTLYRWAGQEDILVGSPAHGRSQAEFARLVGYFVNPLVLRAELSATLTFEDLHAQTREETLKAFQHQDYPFGLLVEKLQPNRDPSYSPLFQVMFALQKSHLPRQEGIALFALGKDGAQMSLGDLLLESLAMKQEVAQTDLMLMMAEAGDLLAASFKYNADLFDRATIERLSGHFQQLLAGVVADSSRHVSAYPILTANERNRLLLEWNDTARKYPSGHCIHELFEAQAGQAPDAEAIVFANERLTYEVLNRRANQVARYLKGNGVGPEARVGICMARSLEMVIAALGVLKAGGAYVPLDPAYPRLRLEFMIEDAQVAVLLTGRSIFDRLPQTSARAICLDAQWDAIASESEANLDSGVMADNLAYVIYTSGSTGIPKGVAIEHRNAVTLLNWAGEVFPAEELSGVLASTSICFDLSIFELFVPLSWGGRVILAENAFELTTLPARDDVKLINTVPSAMTELVRAGGTPPSVIAINLAGEALPKTLVESLYQLANIERVRNLYGPSEDTTYSTYTLMESGERPTIGRPIANTRAYILDARMEPAPVGAPGELLMAGDGLARCYLNRPELTAEKFIPNPFSHNNGERLYQTGDLAKYQPGGNIEFLGRIDHQIKIKGFRIELGEIEAALNRHPLIKESIALLKEGTKDETRLVAYAVAKQQPPPSIAEINGSLREALPDYMIPSVITFLDRLPMTPNGKVDRKALSEIDLSHSRFQQTYAPPRTDLEWSIAGIWKELLQVESVGVNDNFFDLGGHSFLLLRAQSKLRDTLNCDLSVVEMLKYPTITLLARRISQAGDHTLTLNQDDDLAEKMKEGRGRLKKKLERGHMTR